MHKRCREMDLGPCQPQMLSDCLALGSVKWLRKNYLAQIRTATLSRNNAFLRIAVGWPYLLVDSRSVFIKCYSITNGRIGQINFVSAFFVARGALLLDV